MTARGGFTNGKSRNFNEFGVWRKLKPEASSTVLCTRIAVFRYGYQQDLQSRALYSLDIVVASLD